ncbi:MAG: TlpA disulfide reductase family protein [Pyrinomonadaceae bacterium]
MKNLLTKTIWFILLFVVSFNLNGCTNSASTQKSSVENTGSPSSNESKTETKINNFPPAPVAVTTADIRALDESTFKIEDKKGKILLLNLWATWCGPCRAEMPELVAMQEKYKDQNFEIIGLNSDDESPEEIKAFVETMKLNYTIAWSDPKLIGELFKLSKANSAIPQTFLIDREGHLRGVFVGGGAKVVNQLKELVDKTVNES